MLYKIVKIEKISTFTKIVKENDYAKYFTQTEIEFYGQRRRKESLAARYFLKEIIRNQVQPMPKFTDIEIVNNTLGKPILSFALKTTPSAEDIFFSISHTKENIAIFFVLQTNE